MSVLCFAASYRTIKFGNAKKLEKRLALTNHVLIHASLVDELDRTNLVIHRLYVYQ